MSKNNIDNLYKKKFKDFTEVPNKNVWASIEASLDKKKKSHRIIPFWWQLGGVAALLALILYVVNPFGNTTDINTPTLTDIDTSEEKNESKKDTVKTNDFNATTIAQKEGIANSQEEETKENTYNTTTKDKQKNTLGKGTQQQGSYATVDSKKAIGTDENLKKTNQTSIYTDSKSTKKPIVTANITTNTKEETPSNKAFINSKNTKEASLVSSTNTENNTSIKNELNTTAVSSNVPKIIENNLSTSAVTVTSIDTLGHKESLQKKSIFDEIEKTKNEEEAIAANSVKNRWSAGPSIAPVYFDAAGEGSPVNSIFVPNTKSGSLNLSYGLTVSYEVNKRLSIKSGIHKVDYGYTTEDITFSSSLNGATTEQIANITYNTTASNVVLVGNASTEVLNSAFSREITAKTPERDGFLSQQLGYIEVPLELTYAVLNKKIGVALVGGFSSLFLVDNAISLEGDSDGQILELGEANNLNDVNFSANAGIGIDYKFSPKVKFNLEPVFKYQLNTFSQTDGTFNPYSIGVYSGLTFIF